MPYKLLSDKDPAFESKLFQELMKILEIKKIRTSGYRPQTNGLTEQSNSTIKNYLTIFLDEKEEKNNWDLLLKQLAYAYNSSLHTSTNYTPVLLMFGINFRIPIDVLYGNSNRSNFQSVEDFHKNMVMMYRCAKKAMGEKQEKMKKLYDRKRINDPLHIGDFVYVLNPRFKNVKLQPNFEGPFEIIHKSENVYAVQIVRGNRVLLEWLPRDRLRRCYRRSITCRVNNGNDNYLNPLSDNCIDSSSSSDGEGQIERVTRDQIERVPHDYNLRPRPVQVMDRLQVSFLKLM